MKKAWIALWLAAAAPAWAQDLSSVAFPRCSAGEGTAQEEDPQDLRRQIEEKDKQLTEKWKEASKLREELSDLWLKLKGPPPVHFLAEASLRYTYWDHDLGLGNGPGLGLNVVAPMVGHIDAFGSEFRGSIVSLGVRRWEARDEIASGDVDIVSYRLVALWRDALEADNFGWGVSVAFGLTRFNSDAPGGDQDTALDLSFDFPHYKMAFGRSFRVGGSIEWDIMKTSFNRNHTEWVYSIAPLVSVELSF